MLMMMMDGDDEDNGYDDDEDSGGGWLEWWQWHAMASGCLGQLLRNIFTGCPQRHLIRSCL